MTLKMKALFKEWKESKRHAGGNFIEDGVIDKNKWEQSKLKVLFLLKEAYKTDNWGKEKPLNLCNHIREWEGPKYKIWHTVSQWAYGLHKLDETRDVVLFPEEEKDKDQIKTGLRDALFASAVVNIKKSEGNSTSDDVDLLAYVEDDWDRILQQIKLINPHIIICGNTWSNIVKKHLDKNNLKYVKTSEWVYEYDGLIFVDFWHPANHYPNKLNYYALCTAVRLSGVLSK